MSTKEVQEKLVKNMKNWQKVEDQSISSTGKIIEETDNPLIRQIMEIIQNDSQTHYRVQQMIIDSLEKESIEINLDHMATIWDMIEQHVEIEKKTVALAKEALENVSPKAMMVQQYLLEYLLEDEEKHNKLLDRLEKIKKGMYPYAS